MNIKQTKDYEVRCTSRNYRSNDQFDDITRWNDSVLSGTRQAIINIQVYDMYPIAESVILKQNIKIIKTS